MTEILSIVFMVGALLTDTLEVWILVLIGLIIAIDVIVGARYKVFLVFGGLQVIGLAGGFLWAYWVTLQQDVSGPYAWALVVGVWCIVTVVLHAILVTARLIPMHPDT